MIVPCLPCGANLKVPDDCADRAGICPVCRNRFHVPRTPDPSDGSDPFDPPRPSWTKRLLDQILLASKKLNTPVAPKMTQAVQSWVARHSRLLGRMLAVILIVVCLVGVASWVFYHLEEILTLLVGLLLLLVVVGLPVWILYWIVSVGRAVKRTADANEELARIARTRAGRSESHNSAPRDPTNNGTEP